MAAIRIGFPFPSFRSQKTADPALHAHVHVDVCCFEMAAPGGIGATAFDEGTWYHEILEDGLALSYRVRADRDAVFFFLG